jgi:hypothetical protein
VLARGERPMERNRAGAMAAMIALARLHLARLLLLLSDACARLARRLAPG